VAVQTITTFHCSITMGSEDVTCTLWFCDFYTLGHNMNAQGRENNSLSLLQFPSLEPCKGRRHVTS
jgi:hypothetical protein